MMTSPLSLLHVMITLVAVTAFINSPPVTRQQVHQNQYTTSLSTVSDADLLEEIRSLRVKEIKEQLSALSISSADAFEKEELVKRLYEARKDGVKAPATSASSSSNSGSSGADVVCSTLYFTLMDTNRLISAENNAEISIEPSDQPYATVQLDVVNPSGPDFKLSLLLDTACSGFVLRPSVVKQHKLPELSTPVTMTGAGGTVGGTGLTQINKFMFGGETYGPLPAAVQDIGALPSTLDGIIGLSFLSQFACVEMNFQNGSVTLYKKDRRPPIPDGLSVVAEAEMSLTKLGIWTVDTTFDGRGPVKMLVDSGAASTFLNWKGISDMGLSRDSPLIDTLASPMGAMGSDNVAMELTNRVSVQQNLNIGKRPSKEGLAVSGDGIKIDIGDITVLDTLRSDHVGGILGIDILMQCAAVRMTFNGPIPRLLFLK